MPVEFLGMGATNDGTETTPRSRPRLRHGLHAASPAPTRSTAGTGCSPPTGPAARPRRRPPRTSPTSTERPAAAARPPPNLSIPTFAAKTFATLDQISERPAHHPLHHRRQRPRAAARGRLPDQGRPLRPHPRVHPDRQAGLDQPRALRLRRRALPLRGLRARRLPRAAAAPADLVRRVVRRGVRGRGRRGRHLLPVGRAAGRAPPSRSRGSRGRARPPAAPSCPASRSRSGRSSAATEEAAWEKAYATVGAHPGPHGAGQPVDHAGTRCATPRTPARSGCSPSPSRASASTARCGPPPPRPPAARGNSTALVGTPETVAAAAARLLRPRAPTSCRPAATTCSTTPIEFGREVIPLVREEVAQREAEGRPRGSTRSPRPDGSPRTRAHGRITLVATMRAVVLDAPGPPTHSRSVSCRSRPRRPGWVLIRGQGVRAQPLRAAHAAWARRRRDLPARARHRGHRRRRRRTRAASSWPGSRSRR